MATHKQKYDAQWKRTAGNKIKAITKALLIAKGSAIENLNKRMDFWKSGVNKKKVKK